jgi:ArpU family phage transcriptional regulator
MGKDTAVIRQMMLAFGNPEQDVDVIMGAGISAALLYLSDLAPHKERQDFEKRILMMFENKTIIDVLERTIEAIRKYPDYGEMYHAILKAYYFDEKRCSDVAIYEGIHLERTVYYQRKREAVLLFGLQIKACGLVAANGKKRGVSRKK